MYDKSSSNNGRCVKYQRLNRCEKVVKGRNNLVLINKCFR